MSAAFPCTPEQVRSFKENGYVVCRRMIGPELLQTWRGQLWDRLGGRLEDPDTWPRDDALDGFAFAPPDIELDRLPEVLAVVDQFGGGQFVTAGGGGPLVRWPAPPGAEYEFPDAGTGHIDGYGARWMPFMVGVTAYLYDVELRGGGLGFWPRSHLSTQRFFLDNPDLIDGRFREMEGFDWDDFSELAPEEPRQFTGEAGDVMFWHSFLVHGATTNVRTQPRFAIFKRFRHRRAERIGREVPEDLWKYWAI